MERTLGLLVTLLRLSALPLTKPLRKAVLELVEPTSPGSVASPEGKPV
jgi:hypothetical protein